MNFMRDDDFLLLLCNCDKRWLDLGDRQHILTVPERIRLREAGVQTAHEQPAWAMIEPSRGDYNFAYLDTIINRNREAGLKTLIQLCGWRIPDWIPNAWRARQKNGAYEVETLSMWNEEAQLYADGYYQRIIDRHADDRDIGFYFGEFQGNEGIYPSTWPLYDDPALEDYRKTYGTSAVPVPDHPDTLAWFGAKAIEHVQHKQEFLQPKWNEVWNSQQHLMDRWTKSFGNFVQDKIMLAHKAAWPDAALVLCQCTYFDTSHTKEEHDDVDRIVALTGCEVIVEAMYPTGLPETTPKAIAKGFRGQIVQAARDWDHFKLEDWEVNNIRNSYNLWLKHYEDHRDRQDIQRSPSN